MLPTIEFRWSFIYQEEIHLPENEDYDSDAAEQYVDEFVEKVKTEWDSKGQSVLKSMETITGLKWHTTIIPCYVIKISEFGPISDPLTIPIQLRDGDEVFTLSPERFVDMLIHELIHILLVQNDTMNYFENLYEKYPDDSMNATLHIPVHAIHKEIFDAHFGDERLQNELETCKHYPDYDRAWKIVLAEGSKKVLDELRSFNNK